MQPSSRNAFLFVLPALVLYAAFVGLPILQVIAYSFFRWDNGIVQGFAGLSNYAQLAGDTVFWSALLHNGIWVVLTLAFPLIAGLLIAAILAELPPRAVQALGAIYFLPRTVPLVVAGITGSRTPKSALWPAAGFSDTRLS